MREREREREGGRELRKAGRKEERREGVGERGREKENIPSVWVVEEVVVVAVMTHQDL